MDLADSREYVKKINYMPGFYLTTGVYCYLARRASQRDKINSSDSDVKGWIGGKPSLNLPPFV